MVRPQGLEPLVEGGNGLVDDFAFLGDVLDGRRGPPHAMGELLRVVGETSNELQEIVEMVQGGGLRELRFHLVASSLVRE